MDIRFSGFSEEFKDGRYEILFGGVTLGSQDGILLGSLVGASVRSSVGIYKVSNDDDLDGTLIGEIIFWLLSPKDLNMTNFFVEFLEIFKYDTLDG